MDRYVWRRVHSNAEIESIDTSNQATMLQNPPGRFDSISYNTKTRVHATWWCVPSAEKPITNRDEANGYGLMSDGNVRTSNLEL